VCVVAIAGKMGSGKSTFAAALQQEMDKGGNRWCRVAFADALKEVAARIFSYPVGLTKSSWGKESDLVGTITAPRCVSNTSDLMQILHGMTEEQCHVVQGVFEEHYNAEHVRSFTVAQTLQFLGQAVRTADPDYWVRLVETKIEALSGLGYTRVIIDDLRHSNEIAYINRLSESNKGVARIKIVDAGIPVQVYQTRDPRHTSEVELDHYEGWDFIIKNKKTSVEALQPIAAQVAAFIESRGQNTISKC